MTQRIFKCGFPERNELNVVNDIKKNDFCVKGSVSKGENTIGQGLKNFLQFSCNKSGQTSPSAAVTFG